MPGLIRRLRSWLAWRHLEAALARGERLASIQISRPALDGGRVVLWQREFASGEWPSAEDFDEAMKALPDTGTTDLDVVLRKREGARRA